MHRGTWPWKRVAASVAASALVLGGCSGADHGEADGKGSAGASTSAAATSSGSPSADGSGSSSAGGTPSPSPFRADPAKVPKTRSRAETLAAAVALKPQGWGADFQAQGPAVSTPRTVAVLDTQCRWERHELPKGVLASLSRYSEIPAADGKGVVKVSAAVTVHTTVRDADQQLATTLEEPLRCRQQEVRTDEWISQLISTATPYGQGNNTYSDDQVVEIGKYLTGKSRQTYGWYVTRLGTVTLSVSVKGAKGYSDSELTTYASNANAAMLTRLESELGGDS
ncbi:hypothetical protein [Streptomyces mangrovisoli]|uniref:PknH-like extracellular domain-containing protein n=1 Tax=Streptomyces mangrovisoli TaxID=1428628 RepID=A0A1J4NS56_9ACTN|nr:hypothetical protein [Streptomyces mangrovisoli]OIJ64077.1 hypothetical protein WN71_030895 [Streptomyces mangrovisoli]